MWLRYKNDGDTTWTQTEFQGVEDKKIQTVERINGVTLRRSAFSHVVSRRYVYNFIVSADESQPNLSFIRNFLAADVQQISTLTSPSNSSDGDGVYVVHDGGDDPLTYLENIEVLKEFTFKLTEAEPS